MKSATDHRSSSVSDSTDNPAGLGDSSLDVPGMLADRIGDLYASEERRARRQRTDRLIREASAMTGM